MHENGGMTLKVLMVTERYIPIWGGAENQLRQLIPYLVERGIEVEIVTRHWHPWMAKHEKVDQTMVHRLGIPGLGGLKTLSFVLSLLYFLIFKSRDIQIFHSHGAVKIGTLCALAARIRGKKNVAKIATAGRIPELSKSRFGRMMARLFLLSDVIICMTDEIESELRAISCEPTRIYRISNAVDCQKFKQLDRSYRGELTQRHGINREGPLVVFCSRLVHRKGLDVLLTAWNGVARNHPMAQLLVIGSGKDQPDSIEVAMKEKVACESIPRVFFIGETSAPEKYLGIADISVFPSRQEGFPNALMEALAAGLPTVASRIGGVLPLISEGDNGLLFKSEDAEDLKEKLNMLLTDTSLRKTLGENARFSMMKQYSFDRVADGYCTLYQAIT